MKRKLILLFLLLNIALGFTVYTSSIADTTDIVLTKDNHVSIREEVNMDSITNALDKIYSSDPKKTFYLFLDSPGGSVIAGLKLVGYLQSTDRQIVCVATTAISMAFVIFQSCKTRVVTNTAIEMGHEIAAGVPHENLTETKNRLKLEQGLEDMLDDIISKRLQITVKQYRNKLKPEFWLIGGEAILKNHAADSVAKVRCSIELERLTEKGVINTPFGQMQYERSLCPL